MFGSTDDFIKIADSVLKTVGTRDGKQVSEVEVIDGLFNSALKLKETDDIHSALKFAALTQGPDGQTMATCLYNWAYSGFPIIEMGEKFAASLLVSKVTDEVTDRVEMPWPGFLINVPGDMLVMNDPALSENVPIRKIFVTKLVRDAGRVLKHGVPGVSGDWAFIAMADSPITLWRFGVTPKGLVLAGNKIEELAGPNNSPALNYGLTQTDVDERTAVLIGHLIVTSCIALTMNGMLNERKTRYQGKVKAKNKRSGPTARVYTLGKPITLDFRQRVKNYILGTSHKSKDLSVQHLVSGHFKNQAIGKKTEKNVKTIWVTPYWRGPEDAAIPIRAHKMGDQ